MSFSQTVSLTWILKCDIHVVISSQPYPLMYTKQKLNRCRFICFVCQLSPCSLGMLFTRQGAHTCTDFFSSILVLVFLPPRLSQAECSNNFITRQCGFILSICYITKISKTQTCYCNLLLQYIVYNIFSALRMKSKAVLTLKGH